jgi:hypothetical protein
MDTTLFRSAARVPVQTWRGEGFALPQEKQVPQKITTSSKSLVDAAKGQIEEIPALEAVNLAGRDNVVLVDIRDPRELERDGKVPGAFHMTRGMLEFWIDPDSVYFKPVFGRIRNSCSSAPVACARRSPPRQPRTWD